MSGVCSDEVSCKVSLRKNQTHFYHTCLLRTLLWSARSESNRGPSGGLPGRVSIKVGKMMRSRSSPARASCEESQAEFSTAPLVSSCRALRPATTPVMKENG